MHRFEKGSASQLTTAPPVTGDLKSLGLSRDSMNYQVGGDEQKLKDNFAKGMIINDDVREEYGTFS